MRDERWDILSKEQKVLLTVYKSQDGMHLAELCRAFEGEMSKATMIKILQKLRVSKYVVDNWDRVETGSRGFRKQTWVRNYKLSAKALAYVKELHEITFRS